jgi:PKD repeat protein
MKFFQTFLTFIFLFFFSNTFSQGTWTLKASLPGITRWGAVAFSIGDKGYVGTGIDDNFTELNDFWEWNSSNDTWAQKASYGGIVRSCASAFAIGTKGYIGIGGLSSPFQDFWQWDQATNAWTQKGIFPATLTYSVAFAIGNKGYIGTGYDGNYYRDDFWEYDPVADTWAQKASYGGGPRLLSTGFSMGNFGYIGTGCDSTVYPMGFNDFYQYNPLTNAWTQKASFPGPGRNEAFSFSIGNYGYLGGGTTNIGFGDVPDVWRYDPVSDSWTAVSDYGGGLIEMAATFSIGCNGYVVTGFVDDGYPYSRDLWQFNDPSNISCSGGCLPVALFNSPARDFCAEPVNCINFFDLSTCSPTSWQWTFSGGTPSISIQQNPTQICYYYPGTYPVKLVVSNGAGRDSLTVTSYITVGSAPPNPMITIVGGDTLVSSPAATYQWFLNATIISGATSSFYVATQPGVYSVQVSDGHGCYSLGSLNVDVSFLENNSIQSNPYPNPFTVFTTITFSKNLTDASLLLYNAIGQKIKTIEHIHSSKITLTRNGLSEGVYFYHILEKGRRVSTGKLVAD